MPLLLWKTLHCVEGGEEGMYFLSLEYGICGLCGAVAAMGNPTVQSKHSVVSSDTSLSLRR